MSVDTTTLTHTLGVIMAHSDWNALTLHNTLRKMTNRGTEVLISQVRNGLYEVTAA